MAIVEIRNATTGVTAATAAVDVNVLLATPPGSIDQNITIGEFGSLVQTRSPALQDTRDRAIALTTQSGVPALQTHLGTFAGNLIPNNSTTKDALQVVEDEVEDTRALVDDLQALSGMPAGSTDLGAFTGVTIPDGRTVKEALQDLETAVEMADGLALWVTGTAYSVDDFVVSGDRIYRALVSHTSAASFSTDLAAARWVEISPPQGLSLWVTGTTYALNDFVVSGDRLYRATVGHTAAATFAADLGAARWVEVSPPDGLALWATGTAYALNDFVVFSDRIYRATAAHTAAATFAADLTAARWVEVSPSTGVEPWVTATAYVADELVFFGRRLWRCVAGHTAAAAFATDFAAARWEEISPNITRRSPDGTLASALPAADLFAPLDHIFISNCADPAENGEYVLVDKGLPLGIVWERTETAAGAGGGGGGVANLSQTATPANIVINNTGGTGVTLAAGSTGNASLMLPADKVKLDGLGTASTAAIGDFATAAQGALAATAVQPGALAAVATSGAYSDLTGTPTLGTAAAAAVGDFATAAQGALAATALQPGDETNLYGADGALAANRTVDCATHTLTVENGTVVLDGVLRFTPGGTAGTAGQVLTSNGAGEASWAAAGGVTAQTGWTAPGAFTAERVVTGTLQNLERVMQTLITDLRAAGVLAD